MRALLLLALIAAGCNGSASTTAPAAPGPATSAPGATVPPSAAASPSARDPLAPVPAIRVVAGRPDTLLVADLVGPGATVAVPSAQEPARARLLAGGWLSVAAETPGLHLAPITVNGARLVLAVQAAHAVPAPPLGRLEIRVIGTEPTDPSQLRLEVREVDGDGREALPLELDDEESIVALDGNRLLDDNAVYFDPGSGELALDLDALDGGRRRLRLAVRDGARFSRWVEIDVQDRRLATPSETGTRD